MEYFKSIKRTILRSCLFPALVSIAIILIYGVFRDIVKVDFPEFFDVSHFICYLIFIVAVVTAFITNKKNKDSDKVFITTVISGLCALICSFLGAFGGLGSWMTMMVNK